MYLSLSLSSYNLIVMCYLNVVGARIVVELALLPEQAAAPRGRFVKEDGEDLPFTAGMDTYTQIMHGLYRRQPLSIKGLIDNIPALNAVFADKLVEWESARQKQ